MQIWINGQKDEMLDPSDRAFAYGDGVFVTMAVNSNGDIRFFEHYLQRLHESTTRLGFHWSPSDKLLSLLKSIAKNHPLHCVKLLVSRGSGGRGYAPPDSAIFNEMIGVSPIPAHYAQWREKGISLAVSAITLSAQPLLAGIKHCNRLEQVLIKSAQLPKGSDDWLVMDQKQQIIEASMANLVLLKRVENKLIAVTPHHAESGVAGVMREQLLLALIGLNIDVEMRAISLRELSDTQHLLLCNSLIGVVDVVGVDEITFDRWQHTPQLQQLLVPQ